MLERRIDESGLEATLEKAPLATPGRVEPHDAPAPSRLARFEVSRCIGRGSLGVVYEARDGVHGGRVALKLLSRVDGQAIAQLKREFRALSALSHRNLVTLHELVCDREQWFVSMELIEGVAFDRWLWPDPSEALDLARLRQALTQLSDAVSAIHRAGKLHRDLKPSNVLVTATGRVVVLDFGLVSGESPATLAADALIGTPAYMSPEQAARKPAVEASDWYAVGVMLFEVLTHRLPFDGEPQRVLEDKQAREAPRARELSPHVPSELDRLCQQLLARDPRERAGAVEIGRWLGRDDPSYVRRRPPPRRDAGVPLLGREPELQLMAARLTGTRAGIPARLWVRAAPGLGKSALLDEFARRAGRYVRVLRGRCRADESIPLNLFDVLSDALFGVLDASADAPIAKLAGEDAAALIRIFPVLGESPALARAARRAERSSDALGQRQRALAALKVLLGRLALQRPLVVAIDDLHWADLESSLSFEDVFGGSDAPACLFVGAGRGDEGPGFIQAAEPARRFELVELGPLSAEATGELARLLLREHDLPGTPELCQKVALDTAGIPFLVHQLVQQLKRPRRSSAAGRSSSAALALSTALRSRIASLPDGARRLLDAICVADEPLALPVALAAAGMPPDEHLAVGSICGASLARRGGARPYGTLEPYHPQVREAVRRSMTRAEHEITAERLERAARAARRHESSA